ncbi:MAG: ATP-binding protein [Chloroflexia bacterium]
MVEGRVKAPSIFRRQHGWAVAAVLLIVGITSGLYLLRGSPESPWMPLLCFAYLLPAGLAAYRLGRPIGTGVGWLCASLLVPILAQTTAAHGMTAVSMGQAIAIVLLAAETQAMASLSETRGRQRRLQETLELLGAVLDESLSLRALLPVILTRSLELLGAERGEIYLREESSGRLVLAAQADASGEIAGTPSAPSSFPRWLLDQNRPFLSNDLSTDARFYRSADGGPAPARSVIVAPLRRGAEAYGLLALEAPAGHFEPDDLWLLQAVAEKCGIAIENARLYGELRAFSNELEERVRQRTAEVAEAFRLREAILRGIADGVIVADAEGRLLLFNPAARKALPCLDESHIGRPLAEILESCAEQSACSAVLRDTAAFLSTPGEAGGPLRFSDGTRTWVALFAPVTGLAGKPAGAVAVLHDITREVEAIEARTQFVTAVAHELRAPLGAIQGYGDLLLLEAAGPLNPTQRSYLEVIRRSADQMTTLVLELLDLCRLESGRAQVELVPASLRNAAEEAVALVLPRAQQRDLRVTVDFPNDLPLVRADPLRLHQILMNLLTNAIDYTPVGGQVWLRARKVPPFEADPGRFPAVGTTYVEVAVEDTGIGIPPEDLERIFEPLVRLNHPRVLEVPGAGLGLTLVRQLVHLHGGQIWVESTPGRGSTFYFSLPVAE